MGTITAVEWLQTQFSFQENGVDLLLETFEQAKEMKKQQIKECWRKAQEEQRKEFSSSYCSISADKYYNETFNTK